MNKSIRLFGAGALLFAGSYLANSGRFDAEERITKKLEGIEQRIEDETFDLKGKIDEIVKKEVERTRLEVRITLPFGTDTLFTIPDTFSSREDFSEDSDGHDYWKTKVGFKYRVENLTYRLMGRAEIRTGTVYDYTIGSFSDIDEELIIYNLNNSTNWLSFIAISDTNHDTFPDRITINDKINNTSIVIRRNSDNELEYEGCNLETAKSLFDLYTAKFQNFQRVNHIRERIDAYVPRMEITEINPN